MGSGPTSDGGPNGSDARLHSRYGSFLVVLWFFAPLYVAFAVLLPVVGATGAWVAVFAMVLAVVARSLKISIAFNDTGIRVTNFLRTTDIAWDDFLAVEPSSFMNPGEPTLAIVTKHQRVNVMASLAPTPRARQRFQRAFDQAVAGRVRSLEPPAEYGDDRIFNWALAHPVHVALGLVVVTMTLLSSAGGMGLSLSVAVALGCGVLVFAVLKLISRPE
ncbi:MAG: hypothetical protein WD651_04960 [Acidimicrobiia bacterium]